jgi:pyruvate-ferredoxin/flavodoxin oxidoreductase
LLCKNCINICPVGALRIIHGEENIDIENNKFEKIEQIKLNVEIKNDSVNQLQFANSYFNYPNVCQQCGETQYIKLLSKLYGNSLVIANATGCSSIYGGTYGSVPYTPDENGFGIS